MNVNILKVGLQAFKRNLRIRQKILSNPLAPFISSDAVAKQTSFFHKPVDLFGVDYHTFAGSQPMGDFIIAIIHKVLVQKPFDALQHIVVAVEETLSALGAGTGFSTSLATKGRIIVSAFAQAAQRKHSVERIALLDEFFSNQDPLPFLAVLFFKSSSFMRKASSFSASISLSC